MKQIALSLSKNFIFSDSAVSVKQTIKKTRPKGQHKSRFLQYIERKIRTKLEDEGRNSVMRNELSWGPLPDAVTSASRESDQTHLYNYGLRSEPCANLA